MPTKTLTVPYHQQDTGYFCGGATAQMLLRGLGAKLFKQNTLYNQNHGYNTVDPGSGWASPPDGLTSTVDQRKPTAITTQIALAAANSADAISRKIVWAIQQHDIAPIALVWNDDHWIVVHGYDVAAAAQSSDDTTYDIRAFDIRDPWPPANEIQNNQPVPPHTTSDGCGSGGERGFAPQHVTYVEWIDNYMTGVPAGYWNGKFLAVCDSDPLATVAGATPQIPQGEAIVSAADAADGAVAGLAAFGLRERAEWGSVLEGTKPGTPVLVQRLDRLDSYYYIVPFVRRTGITRALALVNGMAGDYRQCAALRGRRESRTVAPQAILKRSLGKSYELPDRAGTLFVRQGTATVSPVLVWKPCVESLSPYFPFHMIVAGDHRLYVRIDGKAFTALHDAGPGF